MPDRTAWRPMPEDEPDGGTVSGQVAFPLNLPRVHLRG